MKKKTPAEAGVFQKRTESSTSARSGARGLSPLFDRRLLKMPTCADFPHNSFAVEFFLQAP
jgi:hypothetical protein